MNGFSQTDEDQGCTNDIKAWSEYDGDESFIFLWSRKLITGDACDVDLIQGKPWLIKWALGPLIDGEIEQHSMRHMGMEYIVLSEYYLDNNEDERFVFGPWWSVHPQDKKWIESFGSPFGPDHFEITKSD